MRLGRISWKHRASWGWVVLLIMLGANLVRMMLPKGAAGAAALTPYTVTLKETVLSRDGIAKVASYVTYAVRSDGSCYRRLVHTEGTSGTVLHMASGYRIMLDEARGLKSTIFKRSVNPARWHRDPRSGCTASLSGQPISSVPETVLGSETVAGYRAVKTSSEPGSGTKLLWWFAVDHGCAIIQDRMEFSDGTRSEHTLIGLIPGEPEPALFTVPASFQEVPPSAMALQPPAAGPQCGPSCQDFLRGLDAEYHANRPKE